MKKTNSAKIITKKKIPCKTAYFDFSLLHLRFGLFKLILQHVINCLLRLREFPSNFILNMLDIPSISSVKV